MDRRWIRRRHRIVRQVQVEVERGDALEEPELVEVLVEVERRDLVRAFHDGRSKTELIQHGHVERLHQRSRVLAEALLAWYELVTVMAVLHLTLLQIGGEADVVVRTDQQARVLSLQPLSDGRDL